MIPEFPKFKKIELVDKEDIEKITSKFQPYSDFNFISLWSWDTKGDMRFSQLHGNLIVRFTDYVTGKPFYSFLGDKEVNKTADILLNFSAKEKLAPKLFLIPEVVALNLDKTKFTVKEDRDNFDYIYDIDLISEYKGKKFAGKRNKTNSFLKDYPNIGIEVLNLRNPSIQKEISRIDEEWLKNKKERNVDFEVNNNDLMATKRCFQIETKNLIGVGISNNKKLVGYGIFEILEDGYSMCDFIKADTHFNYIYDYLMKESAKILKDLKCSLLNFEQDLGVPGLRKSKLSFMSQYLKKFTVEFMS